MGMAFAILSSSAYAEWKFKHVNCAPISKVYADLIDPFNQIPVFGAIEHAMDPSGNYVDVPLVVYWNIEDKNKRFIILEIIRETETACVIAFGNGVDIDVSDAFLREWLDLDTGM